jgi:hypothetical protein
MEGTGSDEISQDTIMIRWAVKEGGRREPDCPGPHPSR